MKLRAFITLALILKVMGEIKIKILVIQEEKDVIAEIFSRSLNNTKPVLGNNIKIVEKAVTFSRKDEQSAFQNACSELASGVSLILDFSWTGWNRAKQLAQAAGVPYLRAGVTINPFIQVADDTLFSLRNASDAVFIFQNRIQLRQSVYYIVHKSRVRVLTVDDLSPSTIQSIKDKLPMPTFVVIVGNTRHVNKVLNQAMESNLLQRDYLWNVVFTDFNYKDFESKHDTLTLTVYKIRTRLCCLLIQLQENCFCPESLKVTQSFLELLALKLGEIFEFMVEKNYYIEPLKTDCLAANIGNPNKLASGFYQNILMINRQKGIAYQPNTLEIYPQLEFDITEIRASFFINSTTGIKLGTWDTEVGLTKEPGIYMKPIKRFFRIGTTMSVPWAYPIEDPVTGERVVDSKGNEVWEGYSIDLIKRLAKDMNFEYELIFAESFGRRSLNGSWSGLIGDLSGGKTDLVISALTMTSEREQVIDFVAPYFEQGGFTIVIRKPIRRTSFFKFVSVLRLEVWLSILASLTTVGVILWLLDTHSPYSAQNNKHLYQHPCRYFTLKESIWFVLTSFTPHGGGEAPKAISARFLVAAYWLFVVLMLSTFTANLAALLTIEKMQTPIKSLDQLASQSRINYTVVADSACHKYFKNMRKAEDTLFKMWKDHTLNNSDFENEYRVWDYPVNEQYGHILQNIEKTGPVPNASIGFNKVLASEQGEFALIHDAAEVRYKISQDCNLLEIGKLFGEQPYAIAVQLSSQLSAEISRRILGLQIDRYFETLAGKYWNYSNRHNCNSNEDTEGITLDSLGGILIATLFGLVLSIITLCAEIIYHRKMKKKLINSHEFKTDANFGILSKKEFGTTNQARKRSNLIKPTITHISVYPRSQLY